MRKSSLPKTGDNLFQRVKRQCREAESQGMKLFRVSIGQPSGPAIEEARRAAAEAIMSNKEPMHEYQDNGSPGVPDFARRFAQCHVKTDLSKLGPDQIDYLPVPGLKPALFHVLASLGSWVEKSPERTVWTMTKPGYPSPADQAKWLPNLRHHAIELDPAKGFMFGMEDLESQKQPQEGDLLMLNFPHNPSGIVATEAWLRDKCEYCARRGVRIFLDGAYHVLSHTDESRTLLDIAQDYPDLNWAEGYSASKAGNFTGWRIAALAGSPEFLWDIGQIKGNADSGFAAPLAAGVIHLFENHKDLIEEVRLTYERRLHHFIQVLHSTGMTPVVAPSAGFFTLYTHPTVAFGQRMKSADEFCELMIKKTGIVGVPFDPYVRYAVCASDVIEHTDRIFDAFSEAQVEYETPAAVAA
jgi:LL-diaminopimelate aminotransferase